ncbi:hypothetical protein JD77_04981 [Micromonospora olivasterospora]|uniref:Uncharacterized protein n=1 Tax=Micromonospora olivasterospora TaxID=1880 RepID=A0A562IGT7_MICOL|nr:hypothetical protein JD77_04981 [Micromonospora olivasterospora]
MWSGQRDSARGTNLFSPRKVLTHRNDEVTNAHPGRSPRLSPLPPERLKKHFERQGHRRFDLLGEGMEGAARCAATR